MNELDQGIPSRLSLEVLAAAARGSRSDDPAVREFFELISIPRADWTRSTIGKLAELRAAVDDRIRRTSPIADEIDRGLALMAAAFTKSQQAVPAPAPPWRGAAFDAAPWLRAALEA